MSRGYRNRVRITRLEERHSALKAAIKLARKDLRAYKASANEWRNENMDQRRLFVTTEKAEGMMRIVIITVVASVIAIGSLVVALLK
jgi:hypothetical protein